ncbi:MAG: glycosyltransferase family 2 protein [Candidatus Micrarchaeia archaeon]
MPARLNLVLPVKNQARYKSNFIRIFEYAKAINASVMVVESGSTDNSYQMLEELKKNYVFELVHIEEKGKGRAVKYGLGHAKESIAGFIDTDLAVSLSYISKALTKFDEGYDMIIGNRYAPSTNTKRKISRLFESKAYIWLIHLLYGSKIEDFQCGFKFVRTKYLPALLSYANDDSWFFDTQLVLAAEKEGLKIFVLPVKFSDNNNTTVRFKDIFYLFKEAVKIKNIRKLRH